MQQQQNDELYLTLKELRLLFDKKIESKKVLRKYSLFKRLWPIKRHKSV